MPLDLFLISSSRPSLSDWSKKTRERFESGFFLSWQLHVGHASSCYCYQSLEDWTGWLVKTKTTRAQRLLLLRRRYTVYTYKQTDTHREREPGMKWTTWRKEEKGKVMKRKMKKRQAQQVRDQVETCFGFYRWKSDIFLVVDLPLGPDMETIFSLSLFLWLSSIWPI